MATTLRDIVTRLDSSSDILGTGTKFKDIQIKNFRHIVFLPKGTVIPYTETFDLDYFETLQVEGKAILVKNAKEFTDNSTENTKQTYSGGDIEISQRGKYEWSFKYTDGLGLFKSLRSLSSNGELDILIQDTEGNQLMTEAPSKTGAKGLSTNYVDVDVTKFNTGCGNNL
jgi:hypothetical protein